MIKFTLVFSLIATTLLVNSLKLNEVVNILSESSHFKAAYEKNLNNLIKQDASYINFTHRVTFDCDLSYNDNRTEVTVHTLRPSDIKLVGAIGDSLTAALGARATLLPEMLTEYRGSLNFISFKLRKKLNLLCKKEFHGQLVVTMT